MSSWLSSSAPVLSLLEVVSASCFDFVVVAVVTIPIGGSIALLLNATGGTVVFKR